MSTEQQEYSIANQEAAIAEYARNNGYEIIRTYADPGESGLTLNRRPGLQKLLADVVSHLAAYKKIIVLDVSRWGRFQDPDEAAHYEFICKSAGIGVIYCAETFHDQNTVYDYFSKVLKRTSAAEYSHELSIRSFDNARRVMKLGFKVGGPAPFAYRRMAVSADGRPKGVLGPGECKALMGDRVTLVHGPASEVKCVRSIFDMCLKRMSCSEIAHEVNRRGIRMAGREFKTETIRRILANRSYTGTQIWNKTTKRLDTHVRNNRPEEWLVKAGSFPPIVSEETFRRARVRLKQKQLWDDRELRDKLKALLARKGFLSQNLIRQTKGMPGSATYFYRFGPLHKIYRMVGYTPAPGTFERAIARGRTQRLRAGLIRQIEALFQDEVETFRLPRKHRQILRIAGHVLSINLCRSTQTAAHTSCWVLEPVLSENNNKTLLCRLNHTNDGFLDFHLLPRIDYLKQTMFTEKHNLLAQGKPLRGLETLVQALNRVRVKTA
jgi:DNA invertase Pin-like site-specific DNA recombinase